MTHRIAIYGVLLVVLAALGGGYVPAASAESIIIGRNAQTQITGKVTRVTRDYFVMESGNKRFDVYVDGIKGDTPINMVVQKGATVTVGGEFTGERFGRAQFDAFNVAAQSATDYGNPAEISPAAGGDMSEGSVNSARPTRQIYSSPKGSFKVITNK